MMPIKPPTGRLINILGECSKISVLVRVFKIADPLPYNEIGGLGYGITNRFYGNPVQHKVLDA